jgi:hypothetical protein
VSAYLIGLKSSSARLGEAMSRLAIRGAERLPREGTTAKLSIPGVPWYQDCARLLGAQ